MGLLGKLLKKKHPADADFEYNGTRITLDMSSAGVRLNGKILTLPTQISELVGILGRTKRTKSKTGIDYLWDELGIFCRTTDGETVKTFGVYIRDGEKMPPNIPLTPYDGEFTVNGNNWLSELDKGVKSNKGTLLSLEGYSIRGLYAYYDDSSLYSLVEITAV